MSGIKETRELLTRYSVARIPFVALHTIERARSLSLLKDVSVDLGLHFLVHTLSKGTYDIETDQIVNEDKSVYGAIDYVSEEMKHRQNLTLVLTEVPDISSDNDNAKQILDLVTLANESGGMVIALTTNSVWSQLQRLGMALTLDLPDENEMYDIISEYINDYRNEITIEWDDDDVHEAAASLVGVTKIETENVIASLIAKKEIKKEDINEVRRAKDRLFTNISGLEKIKVNDSVRDVGGLSGLQNWLEAKQKLLTPAKHAELRQRGLRPPRGILLVGVPGCGKSLSAKSIAYNWNLPLYRLDFATVQGSYVGQTEQQLKDALNTADQVSPCVLWIDEIEKGLSGASSSNDGGVSTRMVGQFLFWLQESQKQVFVVATANDVSKLPSELLRRGRFDELFFVDLPTAEERRDIIAIYMKKYLKVNFDGPFADKVVELSTGFTGADLESTVRDLAYATLSDDSPLDEDLVTKTFQNVVPLSQTSPEKIDQIREWGKSRAVPASGKPIGAEGNLAQTNVNRTRKVLL